MRIAAYDWASGREAMLRFGPDAGPVVVAIPALFEEANRTRAILIDVLRRLAQRGIAGALPDLPGQNESLVATQDARLTDWRDALAAAIRTLPGPAHVVAVRGGALLDGEADVASRWYLSPLGGAAQVRELRRLREAGGGADYGGNLLDDTMTTQLEAAEPGILPPLRIARLAADPKPADARFPAAPPWRNGEPRGDATLAGAMAADIAGWIATCAA